MGGGLRSLVPSPCSIANARRLWHRTYHDTPEVGFRMDIRRILQVVLGALIASILLLGAVIVYQLTREPSTVVVRNVQEDEQEETTEESQHKWEGRGEQAVALVQETSIGELDQKTRSHLSRDDVSTLGALVEHGWFVEHRLHTSDFESAGWRAEWWGETKYGASYYRVQYAFRDGAVVVGPTWLVDLKRDEVVPKNVLARVATSPEEGISSEYYDKSEEVVSAMTRHTFDSGLTLAGALLLYFERRTTDREDDLQGWTIQHDRDALFTAYFQWREDDRTIYAEFDFDYDRKALKAVNLHAANIMQRGEQFESSDPVDILPTHYNPDARRPGAQWTGPARDQYRDPDKRDHLDALGTVLHKQEMIGALEWLLRVRTKTPEQFDKCKSDRNCKWNPEERDDGTYRVTYIYDLGEGEQTIGWDVDLEDEALEPVDRVSRLAYRVVHLRNQ